MGLIDNITNRLLPASVPGADQLDPDTLRFMRSRALLRMGTAMYDASTAPAEWNQRPGLMSIIGHGLGATQWPEEVMGAARGSLELQKMQAELGSGGMTPGQIGVQAVLRNNVPKSESTADRIAAGNNAVSALLQLGTPEAIEASSKLTQQISQWKENAPARGAIDWIAKEVPDPNNPEQKSIKYVAVDPYTKNYIPDPSTGEPLWISDRPGSGVAVTEGQMMSYQGQMSQAAERSLQPLAEQHDQINQLLKMPPATINHDTQTQAYFVQRAVSIMRATAAGAAATPEGSLLLAAIGTLSAKAMAELEKNKKVPEAVINTIYEDLKNYQKALIVSGSRLYTGFYNDALKTGYVPSVLGAYAGIFGPQTPVINSETGKPAPRVRQPDKPATDAEASVLDSILGGQ